MILETARLRLLPFSPEHLLALIEGVAPFEARFGLPAAAGLHEFMVSGEVSPTYLEKLRKARSADVWVHGFGVVHREDKCVIGSAAFKGPPDSNGIVEIAYGIVPGYEGRGYATEVAEALVAFAVVTGRVRLIRAHTRPTANASTRVLTKCRFQHVGEIVDPEDGPVWRWERSAG
jgi:RimJ/RimL family protein N-acetyltransferase